MRKLQTPLLAVCSVGVLGLALTLGNLAGVPDANAQVGVPPAYENQIDQRDQSDQFQQRHEATTRSSDRSMSDKKSCKASDVLGMDVRAKSGNENIGSVEDLMISHDGRIQYVAVSFGGFLGMGDKLFAVPLDAVEFEKTSERGQDEAFARIDVTEQTLRNKKGFDQENWPEQADRSFVTSGSQQQAERQAERPTSPTPSATQPVQ